MTVPFERTSVVVAKIYARDRALDEKRAAIRTGGQSLPSALVLVSLTTVEEPDLRRRLGAATFTFADVAGGQRWEEVPVLNYVFDPVAVVVDWLEACRTRRLSDLLDLYDAKASFRCACEGLYLGREELTRYWSARLEKAVPHAFSLTNLAPDDDGIKPGVALDYVAYDGRPVHIRFQFTETGKIAASACRPSRKVA